MFNNLDQNAKTVDDIFADTEPTPTPVTTPTPVAPVSQAPITASASIDKPAPVFSEEEEKKVTPGGVLRKFLVVIVILIAVAVVAYIVYAKFLLPASNSNETVTPTVQKTATPPVTVPVVTTTEPVVPTISASDLVRMSTLDIKTLIDGSADQALVVAGTLELKSRDTDHDDLFDYQELYVYNTNYNMADTDGDSYSDGAEVKGGYNPNGAGKLMTTTTVNIK
jgi:flagellar basal body-associated protein FliL